MLKNTLTGRLLFWSVLGLASTLSACDKRSDLKGEQGAEPPPLASSKPGACASGGGTVADKESAGFFPRQVGQYCIDPHGETRAYGERASGTVDQICTELFDGECEVYKRHGLERVVTLRYIDGKGSPGMVNINLSRFSDREGAYSFYTKRVVADSDPASTGLQVIEAPGAAALGAGIAYVWRGEHVAELSYVNELESPKQLKASSQRVLPPLAKKLGEQLPGPPDLPPAARQLPDAQRLPLGISYSTTDVLDIAGTGPGAIGYYKDADKRWRVMSLVRQDEASAGDVMKTLKKVEGAKTIKGPPIDALTFQHTDTEGAPRSEWVVTRHGATVLGIGDEPFVLFADNSEEQNDKTVLALDAKTSRLADLAQSGVKAGAKAPSD